MSRNLRTNVVEGGLTVDPSIAPGVVAPLSTFLPRQGTREWWMKTGAGNTAWTLVVAGPTGAVMFFGNDDIGAAADTRFLTPGHAGTAVTTDTKRTPMPRGGILRALYVYHNNPVGDGDAVVYTVRVGGVNTAITCTLASNVAGPGLDITNTVQVGQGALVDIIAVKAANISNGNLNTCAALELF